MSGLADRFRRLADERGVTTLSYFHCDHFEPWRWRPDLEPFGPENAEAVARYVEAMAAGEHSRRLTLFLKPPVPLAQPSRKRAFRVPDDEIAFRALHAHEEAHAASAMRAIVAAGHEIQLHVHHENFTRNEHHAISPDLTENAHFREFLRDRSTPAMDEARFRLFLESSLTLFRRLTGLPFDRWLFVHGMWSLNGSDRDYCCIDREIEILGDLGCVGDFTFPAGRRHCDPAAEEPFLCRPVDAPKGYDLAEAEAVRAIGQPDRGRFFIWASPVSGKHCSIDTYGSGFGTLAEDIDAWAMALVDGAVIADGRLYIKTHAHSMKLDYYADWSAPAWPHRHPAVAGLLDRLFEGAVRAGLAADYPTASEVHGRFVSVAPTAQE